MRKLSDCVFCGSWIFNRLGLPFTRAKMRVLCSTKQSDMPLNVVKWVGGLLFVKYDFLHTCMPMLWSSSAKGWAKKRDLFVCVHRIF